MSGERSDYSPPTETGRDMLETFFKEMDFGNDELREKIKEILKNPESFLGKGGTAQVHDLGDQCIKLMPNRHADKKAGMYNLGNDVSKEYNMQNNLRDLEENGVVVPKVFSFYEGEKITAIVMERLDAANLQMVINSKEEMPETFPDTDADDFFDALEDYIFEMHSQGIAHGDLASRNVMIDKKTGKPRVIDFGRSKVIPKDQNQWTEAHQKLVDEDILALEKMRVGMDKFLSK